MSTRSNKTSFKVSAAYCWPLPGAVMTYSVKPAQIRAKAVLLILTKARAEQAGRDPKWHHPRPLPAWIRSNGGDASARRGKHSWPWRSCRRAMAVLRAGQSASYRDGCAEDCQSLPFSFIGLTTIMPLPQRSQEAWRGRDRGDMGRAAEKPYGFNDRAGLRPPL
jgi:hypothetical protein